MKIYNITFSPTGGTQKIADIVAKQLSENITQISLLPMGDIYEDYDFLEEDVCLIAVPSFGGRVPDIVVKRLKLMKANGTLCILICVYGNRAYDDTLIELKDIVKESGFYPIAAISAVAKHSIMTQYASDRPDHHDIKKLIDFSNRIKDYLESDVQLNEVDVPGNRPYRDYNGVPFVPKASRHCNDCHRCIEECPVGAISFYDPKKVNKDACISCMRCVSICPTHARQLNPILLKIASTKMKKLFVERKENQLFINTD